MLSPDQATAVNCSSEGFAGAAGAGGEVHQEGMQRMRVAAACQGGCRVDSRAPLGLMEPSKSQQIQRN